MNGQLEERVKEAIVAEWKDPNRETANVLSQKVFERIVRSGEEVPEGAMEGIMFKLKHQRLIRGAQAFFSAHNTHGAFVIQEVAEELLLRY